MPPGKIYSPSSYSTPKGKFVTFVSRIKSGVITRSRSQGTPEIYTSFADLSRSSSNSDISSEVQNTIVDMTNDKKGAGSSGGSDLLQGGVPGVTYKEVTQWLKPFDGTVESYRRFAADCERCFLSIQPGDFKKLLNFVWSLMDDRFLHLRSVEYKSWPDLKKALDEYFGIRREVNVLFRELTDMTKEHGESHFCFYNRLQNKCLEYKQCIQNSEADPAVIVSRISHAEEYVLGSFMKSVGMNFRPIIMDKKPKTLQEAFTLMRDLEIKTGSKSSDSVEEKLAEVLNLIKDKNISSNSNFSSPQINRVEQNMYGAGRNVMQCQVCDKFGHKALDCNKLKSLIGNNSRQGNGWHNRNGGGNNNRNNYNQGGNNNNWQGNNYNWQRNNNNWQGNNFWQGNNNRQGNNQNWQRNNQNWQGNYNNWQGGNQRQGNNNNWQGESNAPAIEWQGGNSVQVNNNNNGQSGNNWQGNGNYIPGSNIGTSQGVNNNNNQSNNTAGDQRI